MIRITGGAFKGQQVFTPKGLIHTRPAQAKIREALFSMLFDKVQGAHVCDLFAGSGSLGFEALSREAAHVVFFESEASILRLIQKTAAKLKVEDQVDYCRGKLPKSLQLLKPFQPFDLIFCDPPYELYQDMLAETDWRTLLRSEESRLAWETEKNSAFEHQDLPQLEKCKLKTYGGTMVHLYKLKGSSS
jgi:16S rRNA (guanine966-N2)-methyltransferase